MPTMFTQDRQPTGEFMALSEVSSESRRYLPIGFFTDEVVPANTIQIATGAGIYHFGVLSSRMHSAWVNVVAGRLESRIRYTPSVYYNFPWPEIANANQRSAIETAAQAILDARDQFSDASLADLYDPLTMPPALVKAHATLDKVIDSAYLSAEKAAGRKVPKLTTDAERVAFLFERYQALTSMLPATKSRKAKKSKVQKAKC